MRDTSRETWLEWAYFTRERIFRVKPGLRLPLERVSFLDGDAGVGAGRTRTYFLPTAEGVIVSRRGVISCHDHELREEKWRVDVNGDWLGTLVAHGSEVWASGGESGELLRIDRTRGEIVARLDTGFGELTSFTDDTLLISRTDRAGRWWLRAIDRAGATLWEHDVFSGTVNTSAGNRYLVQESNGQILRCLDVKTGRSLWTFDAKEHLLNGPLPDNTPNSISQGFPSVVVVGSEVLVVLFDRTVCRLDLETGAVLQRVLPPPVGIHLVTETSIFYLTVQGLSEFDHRTMKEVGKLEFPREIEKLFGRFTPYPCAFWVSDEAVIWSDMNGLLLGVSRQPGPDGRPIVWHDRLPKTLVGIADFPLAWGPYFYFAGLGDALGLHCYRNAPPGSATTITPAAKKPRARSVPTTRRRR